MTGLPPDWATIVLTVIAGFFGGSISVLIAEFVKDWRRARKTRRILASGLRAEAHRYLERPDELFQISGNSVRAEALIVFNSIDRILKSEAFFSSRFDGFLAQCLSLRNHAVTYNHMEDHCGRPEYFQNTIVNRLNELLKVMKSTSSLS